MIKLTTDYLPPRSSLRINLSKSLPSRSTGLITVEPLFENIKMASHHLLNSTSWALSFQSYLLPVLHPCYPPPAKVKLLLAVYIRCLFFLYSILICCFFQQEYPLKASPLLLLQPTNDHFCAKHCARHQKQWHEVPWPLSLQTSQTRDGDGLIT